MTTQQRMRAKQSWMTVTQVAEHLGVTPAHVRELIQTGALEAIKGRRPTYRVCPTALDEFIRGHLVGSV
jgi:excisionase family DNA binding protein